MKLDLTPQELDFVCGRMIAGSMDYQTFCKAQVLLEKIVKQANDKELQAPPKQLEIPDA